jgi:hypothetical protein
VIVGWTGHRPALFLDLSAARAAVESTATELVRGGEVSRFLVGGQRGVDTWAALAAMSQRVPFTLVLPLPVPEFSHDWSDEDRSMLERTVAAASDVRVIGADPAGAYSERNRVLAAESGLLVAVWTGIGGGGTAETIALARAAGTPVREILLEAAPSAGLASGRGI